MKILFIHQNCPGQFKHLAPYLAKQGHQVLFLTQPGKPEVLGVKKIEYVPSRLASEKTHHYLRQTEQGILNGQAAAKAALSLSEKGFKPDVVVAHMGWGEALYIKNIWPETKLLGYFEWYYQNEGSDAGFLARRKPDLEASCKSLTRNALHLLNLQVVDQGISPTYWQLNQHPEEYREKITVLHEGVNTQLITPNKDVNLKIDEDLTLNSSHEVITYVARNLEPYRGFPSFMHAAAILQKKRPSCHIVVVGGDGVSYGRRLPNGQTYRELLSSEL
ncbi:MAG: glycosyl transferase family 1, partial [Gammaproteobacteria bacterium]|nr:glycosyl transferase family 1 [Gammaproteobacteria bacterium]